MQKNRVIIWMTFVIALGLSVGAVFLPTPADWPTDTTDFHWQLVINIIMACFHTAGAILFWVNLDVYKTTLRRAYRTVAAGALIAGAGTLQLSLLTLIGAWQSLYAKSGATMLPFLLSGVVLYLGVRLFARLIGVQSILTRTRFVFPGAIIIAFLSSFIPHAQDPRIPEITYDLLVGISVWSSSLMLVAGILAGKVRQHAGTHYVYAMKWLTRALIFSAFVLLYQAVYTLINLGFEPTLSAFSNLITVISGVIWIRAGYAFALTKYYDRDIPLTLFLFGRTNEEDNGPKTVVDMVVYAASLVSNSRDIDPLLDSVRTITAKLRPGESPSQTDVKRLVEVYLYIEHYLIEKEAIRAFSPHELRSHFTPELRKLVGMYDK